MKACQIAKTSKEYKIITMYKTDTGSYRLAEPVFILSKDVEDEILTDKLSQSLNSSRLIVNPNKSSVSEFLKLIKESSIINFYKKSTSCLLYWEDNVLTIEPQAYSQKFRGLETIKDKILTLDGLHWPVILEQVKAILNNED